MTPRHFSKIGPAFNPADIPIVDPREHPEDQQWTEGFVIKLPRGGYLMRCSRSRPWQQITKEDVRSGQPRPYADTINEALITFSGGSPSSLPGWHLPFATRPPFDPKQYGSGAQVFDQYTKLGEPAATEARSRRHDQRVKDVVRPMMWWVTDKTVGEPRDMGDAWLEVFECVEALPFSTTYRVIVHIPFMD